MRATDTSAAGSRTRRDQLAPREKHAIRYHYACLYATSCMIHIAATIALPCQLLHNTSASQQSAAQQQCRVNEPHVYTPAFL